MITWIVYVKYHEILNECRKKVLMRMLKKLNENEGEKQWIMMKFHDDNEYKNDDVMMEIG